MEAIVHLKCVYCYQQDISDWLMNSYSINQDENWLLEDEFYG
jgi:hypothetical protein